MNESLDRLEERLKTLSDSVEDVSHLVNQAVGGVEHLTQALAEIQHQVKALEAAVPDVANGQGELKFSCELLEGINSLQGLLQGMHAQLKGLAKDPRVGVFFAPGESAPPAVHHLRHELSTTYEALERLRWLMEEANIDSDEKGEPNLCRTDQQIDDFFARL